MAWSEWACTPTPRSYRGPAHAEQDGDYRFIRRGWCLGGNETREELLSPMSERIGAESDKAKAERIIREALRNRGWRMGDLDERIKDDPEKVMIAMRLRGETVRSAERIVRRLHLGSRNYANQLL